MAGERFDVLVVGSGPAGSVAALVLGRGGARVALVDKARFPRDKACGDLVEHALSAIFSRTDENRLLSIRRRFENSTRLAPPQSPALSVR